MNALTAWRRRCWLAAILWWTPGPAASQVRWISGYAQATASSEGFGTALTGELGVFRSTRVSLQWFHPFALGTLAFDYAPSQSEGSSEASPRVWELGIRQGLGVAEKIAPFVGAGVGAYRHTWRTLDSSERLKLERRTKLALSGAMGLDFMIAQPLSFRLALFHHEVFSEDLERIYGSRVRITALMAGLGYAVW